MKEITDSLKDTKIQKIRIDKKAMRNTIKEKLESVLEQAEKLNLETIELDYS